MKIQESKISFRRINCSAKNDENEIAIYLCIQLSNYIKFMDEGAFTYGFR